MVQIRRALEEDSGGIRALTAQLGYPASQEDIAARLQSILGRDDHRLLVAASGDGRLVGWAHGMLRPLLEEPVHIFLGGLVVDEKDRNQGIGQELMAEIEAWGQSVGAREIHVYSNVIRERAHKFYESLGYESDKVSKVLTKAI